MISGGCGDLNLAEFFNMEFKMAARAKGVFKHQDLQMFSLTLNKYA